MSWITLAESDVQTRLAGAELTALKTVALSSGQTNPLPEIISEVIQEVRGRVAGCQNNRLGDGATIPSELKSAALAMIRYRLATRLPVSSLLTDDRREENKQAISTLGAVARCEFRIEQPATPSTQVIAGPATQLASSSKRRATRHSMKGL